VRVDVSVVRRVQEALHGHPDVLEAACLYPGARHAEFAVAVVPNSFASAVAIRDHLWCALGENQTPDLVAVVPELPRELGGEVDLEALRAVLAVLDEDQCSRYVEPDTPTERELTAFLLRQLRVPRIGVLDDFVDLGADSVIAMRLSAFVQTEIGVVLEPARVFEAGNVRELARLVHEQVGGMR
jgi:acyl carrier protein